MEVLDFDGSGDVRDENGLLRRLRSVRRGEFGAFVLSNGESALWVHINGEAAYLWYLANSNERHPGWVPDGMWTEEQGEFKFMIVGGYDADAIFPPWWQLVPKETAYRAAVEFLHSPGRPRCINWFEL